jgi:hypothetical protein
MSPARHVAKKCARVLRFGGGMVHNPFQRAAAGLGFGKNFRGTRNRFAAAPLRECAIAIINQPFVSHSIIMKTIRMCITAFILCAAALVCNASDPSGVWKFEFEGSQGRKLESTLTLKLDGDQLSGAIDNRGGKVEISDAKLEGDQISFNVVHKIRLRTFTTSYSGRLDGDTIKGSVNVSGPDGRKRSREWVATRLRAGASRATTPAMRVTARPGCCHLCRHVWWHGSLRHRRARVW